jgi:hypothetical protein
VTEGEAGNKQQELVNYGVGSQQQNTDRLKRGRSGVEPERGNSLATRLVEPSAVKEQ